jgi:hypothetical protein
MNNNEVTTDLAQIINETTDGIIASWISTANAAGIPVVEFVELKLDEMEENEPAEVRTAVGAAWLRYAVPMGL